MPDLHESAIADLARSGISEETAERAGLFSVESAAGLESSLAAAPALVIPYFLPDGQPAEYTDKAGDAAPFFRVRYLAPVRRRGKKSPQRYAQPGKSGVHAYFPQTDQFDWAETVRDTTQAIVITEGEKKALCLSSYGIATVGLGGVFNFTERGGLLESLAAIDWQGRDVFICFDSDAAGNNNILTAEARLTHELTISRRANVYIMRIPAGDDGEKVGLDDYIVAHGIDAFTELASKATHMTKMDAEVVSLNSDVCWVERDGMVFDKVSGAYLNKGDFVKGSVYSTRKIIVPAAKGPGVRKISVADEWLTHPHAERYADTRFVPSGEPVIDTPGGRVLNLWQGFRAVKGDAKPFVRLTDFIFRHLPPDVRDFPLKLMAYKFQNPTAKPPLALVLLGPAGSGKSLWAKAIRTAAGRHGVQVPSAALMSEFNGWVESALIAVVDEAQAAHVSKGAEVLKRRISEKTDLLNEKYRVARQVDTYTMYILTANDLAVGAYDIDDRRMFVVNCGAPHPDGDSFYRSIAGWLDSPDGAAMVAHYLLNYDLKGWVPPIRAPLTPEKHMAHMESRTPAQRLAGDMLTADDNVIALWISQSVEWANALEIEGTPSALAKAREIKAAMGNIQVRPWYTADEISLLFPALTTAMQGGRGQRPVTSGALSRELRAAGVPYLLNSDDPRGFMYRGRLCQYLVVADPEEWARPITQAEFERQMAGWPSYAEYAATQRPRRIIRRESSVQDTADAR